MHSKLIIIGSGPAGYTAGIYAARAMLEPILIRGLQPGGQLTITTEVENWPGNSIIQGPELMTNMEAHARSVGVTIFDDHVTNLDTKKRPFELLTDKNELHSTDAVILATGAQAKWLGLPSEEKYKGFGVSACATCDGFFYRDKDVVVVGGGNTAVEEAIFLTKFARKVTLIHRRNKLRADRILQERLMSNNKINILWDHEISEILGKNNPVGLNGVKLRNVIDGKHSQLNCDGVFIAIGHSPASELVIDKLKTEMGGYVVTAPDSTKTSVEGIFAAGDITDSKYRQAVTSAGMGCMAALEAEQYLSEQEN